MTTVVANPPVLSLSPDAPADRLQQVPRRSKMATTASANGTPAGSANATPVLPTASKPASVRSSPRGNASPDTPASGRVSPPSSASRPAAKVRVKKEPPSPTTTTTSRPRPRRLDLSASALPSRGPQTAGAALASKESAGLAIKDLGVACLSPGFQTQDPALREQLARSLSVRDQQRQLIEARQKGTTKNIASQDPGPVDTPQASGSRKKGPPPGLSIHPPAAAAFANERVVQSAPLGQSFTGLRGHNAHPPPRNMAPSAPSGHPSAQQGQPGNRLPPISDVFNQDRMDGPTSAGFRPAPPVPSPGHPPKYSPSYPPPQYADHHHPHDRQHPPAHHDAHAQQPPSSRPREFRSAEEAVHGMANGRDELLPKIVHYGGAQPPTPPSPGGHEHAHHPGHASASYAAHHHPHHAPPPPHGYYDRPDLQRTNSGGAGGRRRTRDEYERDHDSPAVPGEPKRYHRAYEDEWHRGMSQREKREEFLRLCERAWDLFHS